MKKETSKSQRFSIYLVKTDVPVDNNFFTDAPQIHETIGSIGTLYVFKVISTQPKWLSLFTLLTSNKKVLDIKNMTNSAIFHFTNAGRDFLISFGYAKSKIPPEKVEDDFGIKTCLNVIDEKSIREVVRQSLTNKASKKKEQSLGNTDIGDFEIEEESDLLRSITGKPSVEAFGKRIGGTQSLSIYDSKNIQDIIACSPDFINAYTSQAYKKHFGWIDKIKKLSSKQEIDRLDICLVKDIQNRNTTAQMWAGIPDIIDWNTFDGFSFKNHIDFGTQSDELFDDPSIDTFINYFELDDKAISIDYIKNRRLYYYSDTHVNSSWSFYQCIYYERKEFNKLFILNSGTWYLVEDNFYQDLLTETNQYIPNAASTSLIDCTHPRESKYNEALAKNIGGHLFDDVDIIPYGGRNNVEVCDVYKNFEFYHIKIYGGSYVLSHLFNQGLVSANLTISDPNFRNAVIAKLNPQFEFPGKGSTLPDHQFKVVYGIITKYADKFAMPLFSRITLRNAFRSLKAMHCIPVIELINQKYDKAPRKIRKPRKSRKQIIPNTPVPT